MELSQIKTFIQIARSGSMTKASSELHRTQPALSSQLAKLEEELGENLFDRTPKGMELTDAGKLFLGYAKQSISRLEDGITALTQFRGLEHGSLSVGGGVTATTYLLPKYFGKFRQTYPNIRLHVHDRASSEVIDELVRGAIDLGLITLPTVMSEHRNVHVIPWAKDELVLIVPPGHELSGSESFQWSDLDGVPLVLFETGSAIRAQIDIRMSEADVSANVVMELRSVEAIKQMVSRGIGAAFVSQHCLPKDGIQGIPCADGPIRRTLAVVHRNDVTMNPAAIAFLDLLVEVEKEEESE